MNEKVRQGERRDRNFTGEVGSGRGDDPAKSRVATMATVRSERRREESVNEGFRSVVQRVREGEETWVVGCSGFR